MLGLRKQNRRKQETQGLQLPRLNWRRITTAFGFFALATALGYGAIVALDQPIRVVSVQGKFQRVSPVQVEEAVTHGFHEGLMTVDLERVRHDVERLPWVDQARVQRLWPNGLRIDVTEQIAAARWGDTGLLNTRGELFLKDARHVPPELPRLSGPEGTEQQVAQRYLSAQGRLIEAGMRLAALELDARGAWNIELANGIAVRLGRRQVDERLDRFIDSAIPVLGGRVADIDYVDMRYSNGFAIGWKHAGSAASSRDPDAQKPSAPPARSIA